jgi:hypothetical protein
MLKLDKETILNLGDLEVINGGVDVAQYYHKTTTSDKTSPPTQS